MKAKAAIVLLPLLSVAGLAQAPAPDTPKNAVGNGGFERTVQVPNLWTGVDKDGFLAGFRAFLPVLNASGDVADTPMPAGVAVGDLNGDGLPDILSSDPLGYVRIYFNEGSQEEPKFVAGQLTFPWLASGEGAPPWRPEGMQPWELLAWNLKWAQRRFGVRASLSDVSGRGKLEMMAGNYFGDVFLIPNAGSAEAPLFAQPPSVAGAVMPTTKDPLHRWGNVFAPLLHDWDNDGKADLLVGEGSYSANNVHLFLNQGSSTSPVFNEDKRQPLALGQGRQQLTPALADMNGDGLTDILVVADRRGHITAYLRPGNWTFGDTIPPAGFLARQGGLTADAGQAFAVGDGIHTIATGDMNGDGLFDLVLGKANGRIAMAINQGTKESPKFEEAADLTGKKPAPVTWRIPSQWEVDTGTARGNFLAYADCVSAQDDANAQPAEGTRVLKFGFAPGSVNAAKGVDLPGTKEFRFGEYEQFFYFYDMPLSQRLIGAPSRIFMMQQFVRLETGRNYALSLKHKGSGVRRAHVFLGWWGLLDREDRRIRGARGAVTVVHNDLHEHGNLSRDFRPGASWSTLEQDFVVRFKQRELKDVASTHKATLIIAFELTAPDGFLYLDDIKLVPQG